MDENGKGNVFYELPVIMQSMLWVYSSLGTINICVDAVVADTLNASSWGLCLSCLLFSGFYYISLYLSVYGQTYMIRLLNLMAATMELGFSFGVCSSWSMEQTFE